MTETELETRERARRTGDASRPASDRAERVTTIRPAPRWQHLDFRELWHYRELLVTLAWRDVAVRYEQTSIGVTWAI